MKDVSIKRILRYTIATFLVMVLWSFVAGSGIAAAETGTITVTDSETDLGYTVGGAPAVQSGLNYARLNFRTSEFNSISSFWVSVPAGTLFKLNSNYTFFTCQAPNSCSGSVSYSKANKIMNWDFAAGSSITSSPIFLTYEQNIFDTNNVNGIGVAGVGVGATDPNKPVFLALDNDVSADRAYNGGELFTMNAEVSLSASANYNILYQNVGSSAQYYGSIDKSGSVPTLFKFENSTAVQHQEAALGTADFNLPFIDYTTGLYINMTTATASNRVLINSTGAIGVPTPTATPVINPLTGKGIIWDKSNYTLGETGVLSWSIDDSIWNLFSTQTIVIKKTDSGDVFTSVANIAPQTGSYQFLFSNCAVGQIICGYGTYQGIIYTNLFGLFETGREVATAQVFPASSSYILINSSVPIKTNVTATIFIGQGGVLFGNLKTQFLQEDGTYIDDRLWSTTLVTGTQNTTINFAKIGTYRIIVDDGGGGELASKIISTFSSSIVPPYNVATSRIILDKTSYNFDEVLTGNYEVDNTNYSTGFPTYIDVFNYDINSITGEFYGQGFGLIPNWADTSLQIGSVGIPIQDSAPQSGFQGIRFVSGNNSVRLRISNITSGSSSTLASYNFTLSKLNTAGYSLEIIPNDIPLGSSVKIKYIIPSASSVVIITPGNKETIYSVSSSSTMTYKPKEAGTYYIYLKDSSGDIQVSRTLNVKQAVVTATPSPDRGTNGILTIMDGWVGLLGFGVSPLSKFFFAWLITTIFIIGGFATGRGAMAGTILGAGSWGWFMTIGYLPQWFVIVVVLQLVLASRWFR